MKTFSLQRLWAIIIKEFIQMKRDRVTFGMMIGIPLIQLILFGYAINSDPKNLPTAIIAADQSDFTRTFINGMQNTGYFKIIGLKSDHEADHLLKTNQVQFILSIPQNFTERLVRNMHPQLLLVADGTDPAATSFALSAFQSLTSALNKDAVGAINFLHTALPPFNLIIQTKYNPERITQYNIVPGLLGVVLTMTMVVITALAITRERERGTMENLLSMPVIPVEIMLGKLIPYILIGYVQASLILFAAYGLFHVPIQGSLILMLFACMPFIAANLVMGLTFSTLAKNQLQAMQLSFFFFLPSILLSGFMFPFRGMPEWAQFIGNLLPLTHFLVIVRGILLKGNTFLEIFPRIEAILLFFIIILALGIKRYRQTLD
jgi:ABC-2 type transport system permease protein